MLGCSRFRCFSIVLALLASAGAVRAQDPPITGARFTLLERSEGSLSVTLENVRDVPLVAWQIVTVGNGSNRTITTYWRDRTSTEPYSPGDGPIPARGRRVLSVEVGNSDGRTASMHLAVFADGYYEGVGADRFLQQRREEAEDLRYWIDALRSIARAPDSDVRRALEDHLAERGSHMKESSAATNLQHLVADGAAYSPASLRSALAARVTQMQERLAIVDRPMIPGPLQRSSDVPSVRITSTPSTTSRLYGVVENVRGVPIEALGFQQYEQGTHRLRGGTTHDFCGTKGAPSGSGAIQPGERREIAMSWERNPDGSLPDVKLHFVLFEDLKFEGSLSERDSILKNRERRAADAEYWITALTTAATQSPEKAREYLETKRRERAAQMAVSRFGSATNAQTVDSVIERTTTAPTEFAAMAVAIAANLEQQRLQFMRHLSK